MNKHSLKVCNLKLYKSITSLTASFVLATSLSAVPVCAHVDDIIEPIEIGSTIDSNEKEVMGDNNVKFNCRYDNEKDAYDKKNQKVKEYEEKGYKNVKSEIVKYNVEEKTNKTVEKYINSDISVEKGAYLFDNLDDAYNKKDELESSNNSHDMVVTVNINKNLVNSGEYETININKAFSSSEKAYAYLNNLEKEGYEIEDSTVIQDTDKSYALLDQNFDTYEEAEDALNDFENTYDEVETDGIIENRTDMVIDSITDDNLYETEDMAWEAVEEFLNDPDNETDEYYFTGEVVESDDSDLNTTVISERFDSEEEALEYIGELEEEGYTIDDYTFTCDGEEEQFETEEWYDTYEEAEAALDEFEENHPDAFVYGIESVDAGTVYEVETIGPDMKIYETGRSPYAIIKDVDDVYVWTENYLSEDEQVQFKDTYESVSSDPILTWEMLNSDNVIFIDGYDTFQSFSGKEISFELDDDDNVQIDMDIDDESYIVYGSYEPIDQYILSVPGSDSIELESGTLVAYVTRENSMYYAKFNKMAKTYSVFAQGNEVVYEDSYTLHANCLKPVMVNQYSLDVTKEVKNYSYSDEVINKSYYNLVVSADIVHELENTTNTNNISNNYEEYTQVPSTKDSNNMVIPFAGLVASTALAGVALVKKKKRY